MPSNRKVVFANNEYYHVFNRGVEKRPTFTNKYEFLRAMNTLSFYRFAQLPIRYSKYLNLNKKAKEEFMNGFGENNLQVEIMAFCFMGNHFHFLLKQKADNGIAKFMAQFTNSYTKYFNTKHQRVGPLFQGVFKAVYVEDDEQFLQLSRYIHLNPVNGFFVMAKDLDDYLWSSYPEYLGLIERAIVNPEPILNFFKSREEYKKFVMDEADFKIKLSRVEHLLID